jgi:beta-xylosidase
MLRARTDVATDTPVRKDYSLTVQPGLLTLNGGPYTLSSPICPTLFLRKQRHWPVIWETKLDFQPEVPRVEAGTVVWWNYTCYASIGIALRQHDSQSQRIVRFTSPDAEVLEEVISEKGEVKFVVESTPIIYRFGYHDTADGKTALQWLGEVDTEVMTRNPEIGQPFTGMMMGLYAFGELQPVLTPAHFAYAEFR